MESISFSNALKRLGTQNLSFKNELVSYNQLTSDFATYLKYHRGVSRLRKSLETKAPLSPEKQKLILKDSILAEDSLASTLNNCLSLIEANSDFFNNVQSASKSNFDDLQICTNLSLLPKEIKEAVVGSTLKWSELSHYQNVFFGGDNGDAIKSIVPQLDISSAVTQIRTRMKKKIFLESEEELRKQGIITFEGGDDPVPYIVGAAVVVVGVVVIVASGGVAAGVIPGVMALAAGTASTGAIIGGSLVVAGLTLLATEAYQDITEQQDGKWEIIAKFKKNFDLQRLQYSLLYGNHNPNSMEVHKASCTWLRMVNPVHIKCYLSIDEAHNAGLDNCAYCMKGSLR